LIWSFCAALLALLFVYLSVRTFSLQRRLEAAIGDGGDPLMLRAMRTRANSAEYVPPGFLLIAGREQLGGPALLLHGLGLLLLAGRLAVCKWTLAASRRRDPA
jgi:uncharacterized membrane protein YecN with MAPEG domain